MRSWPKPTDEQIDRAMSLIAMRPQHRRYFFERLKNPMWAEPLAKRGAFSDPPAPIEHKDGGISFPPWPESRYLASVAPQDPETVMKVIRGIPETDNVMVHWDLVEAALTMPAQIAKEIVTQAVRWAHCRYSLGLPAKLGELIVHLADGTEGDGAFNLATELFAFEFRMSRGERQDTWRKLGTVYARFDAWQYGEILRNCLPHLLRADPRRALKTVCELLSSALGLEYPRGRDGEAVDFSCIWRTSIGGPGGHDVTDVKNSLVEAVRDAGEAILRGRGAGASWVFDEVWSQPWPVFKRIELHLLSLFAHLYEDRMVIRLTDRHLFYCDDVEREYLILLGQSFRNLPPEGRELVLKWIGEGPEGDYSDDFRARWELRRLSAIEGELPPEKSARYQELKSRYTVPGGVAFGGYWTGPPRSPKEPEELARMEVVELSSFLRGWRPDPGPCAPSPEGLGRVLRGVIAGEPEKYAAAAGEFTGLQPTYVRAVVSGLRDGLKESRPFDWDPVISLCEWAVRRPRDHVSDALNSEWADKDWAPTRHEIAHLLWQGLGGQKVDVPFLLRARVWSVIEVLLEDPEPTREAEAEYEGTSMCPITLSLNAVRSEALRTAIRYGLWCMLNLKGADVKRPEHSPGLGAMPELRWALEAHLDVAREPSLAVRSVYGEWFPQLVLLDSDWSSEHVDGVFPTAQGYEKFFLAAWETYVILCPVYDVVARLLGQHYGAAVVRLAEAPGRDIRLADPREKVSEHLMTMYARGMLDEGIWKGLLDAFWRTAPETVRGHAIAYVGRSVYSDRGSMAADLQRRLRSLWEGRLAAARVASDRSPYLPEVEAFGWWFASGKFDPEWSLIQLEGALEVSGGRIEPPNRAVERLAALCGQFLERCLECLGKIMRAEDAWSFFGWGDKEKDVIREALRGSDARVKDKAQGLISELMARGSWEYRDLLTGSGL